MDEKEKIIEHLDAIANGAKVSADRNNVAVAGILKSVIGAMRSNEAMELFLHVCKFSDGAIQRIRAQRN